MNSPLPGTRQFGGAPHSSALLGTIAARLATLAEDAEAFGIVLCSDGDVAARYLVQLQQIDRLAQSLRELAGVLSATDPEAAVSEIRLGELRLALEEASGR
jgi:hypothetical protein